MASETPLTPNSAAAAEPATGGEERPKVSADPTPPPAAQPANAASTSTPTTTPTSTPTPSVTPEAPRVDVSASTITRMMGIASTNDLRLVEGRVDVLTSKVAALLVRVEKVLSMFNSLPKSADIDRLEVQMSTVKSMIRELSENIEGSQLPRPKQEQDAAAAQAKKLRDGIKSNQD